jgi:hypothetical protein
VYRRGEPIPADIHPYRAIEFEYTEKEDNGLFDCHRNGVPVLAIAAHIPSREIGIDYFQATHPESLFKDCSHYVELVSNPGQLPQILKRAIRIAVAKRGARDGNGAAPASGPYCQEPGKIDGRGDIVFGSWRTLDEGQALAEPFGLLPRKCWIARFCRAGTNSRNGFGRRITSWRAATRTCRVVRGRQGCFSRSFTKPVQTEGGAALEFSIQKSTLRFVPPAICRNGVFQVAGVRHLKLFRPLAAIARTMPSQSTLRLLERASRERTSDLYSCAAI